MKNFVQKEVNKQLDKLQDNKEENYNKIVEIYFKDKPKKKKTNMWKILIPSLTAFVLIFVSTIAIILNNVGNVPKEYFSDNEVVVDATIAEISNDAKAFSLSCVSYEITENKRIYDSISGDTLRYRILFEKNDAKINIVYITNTNYQFEYEENNVDQTKEFQNVEVKYLCSYDLYTLNAYAYLEKDGQKLVITYTERSMTNSEDPFWSFMNEFVTVK